MKVQKRPRSSIRARRTACFSVSSSSRYMSLTSCRALSSWGCRSPFPGGVGRRGRAGDASLARHIRGSGPALVSLAVGLGIAMGARGLGRAIRPLGLVEGLVPGQAERTDRQRQTHRRNTEAAKPPRTWAGRSPGQPQGRLWGHCAQGSPAEASTEADASMPQGPLAACKMAPPRLVPQGGMPEAGQSRARGISCRPGPGGHLGLWRAGGAEKVGLRVGSHSAQGATHKDSNSDMKQQREREARG